ncbi:capsular polysaccharide biosynthesis protein [Shewanella sp. UCD-KL12]|uniref:capsular polysaccharide biosynthesis protein n=1 Tax=Shewanella sp. UCD-KL12 TaxID=1917163 RepID=UPI00097039BD|nr:capsular polysaccharide biosynthesis protein [Shewanella sp. UCD-KL12]
MISPRTSTIWTGSNGIAKDAHIAKFFEQKIEKFTSLTQVVDGDVVVGWGNKANTKKACQFANEEQLPYLRLEDGFISYLAHPLDNSPRLSLIKDCSGIYYDAGSASDLENLCTDIDAWYDSDYEQRALALKAKLTQLGISKYNHLREALPDWLVQQADNSAILVVDQTQGDVSVTQGMGTSASFSQMIEEALAAHPEQKVIVKTHPDVIKGKKSGFVNIAACSDPRVHLLGDDCELKALLSKVERVYTVTSQLGFEALLYGLPVHCYGLPFYAGWGLTEDKQRCDRRTNTLTLAQLIAATLIKYPNYLDPETQESCEVEAVVDWLALQLEDQHQAVDTCYAFGFSLWKRAFIKPFIGRKAKRVVYIKNQQKLEALIQSDTNAAVLLWGKSRAKWAEQLKQYCPVWFMEDGFIRSVGLGADLRRPSCLVIDRQGMYYAPDGPSDVVEKLNNVSLSDTQSQRAKQLAETLVKRALSKYNVGQKHTAKPLLEKIGQLKRADKQRELILVPGQFEQDQSIASSRGKVKSNLALIKQVRQDYPDAFIMYKEHPDLYSGVRPGALGEQAAQQYADIYLADIDIVSVLMLCDRVCTITSLTGFEALLRGKKVTTYGSPFYAGWGLTDDAIVFAERTNKLSLEQLVYVTLVSYPSYVDWTTGKLTSPERVIRLLSEERAQYEQQGKAGLQLSSSWLSRFSRKVRYFYEAWKV